MLRWVGVEPIDLEPRVFWRITDKWLELSARFILGTHNVWGAKDAMSRNILAVFDEADIGIASATYDIVGLPPVRMADRTIRGIAPGPAVCGTRTEDQ